MWLCGSDIKTFDFSIWSVDRMAVILILCPFSSSVLVLWFRFRPSFLHVCVYPLLCVSLLHHTHTPANSLLFKVTGCPFLIVHSVFCRFLPLLTWHSHLTSDQSPDLLSLHAGFMHELTSFEVESEPNWRQLTSMLQQEATLQRQLC